jgi:uncharacterized protein (UPF0332 family)
MDPQEFLDLAGEWVSGTREGEWRSGVSRAYYAVFHAARRVLAQGGFRVPDADRAHGYLWLRLQNSGHPDIEEAGRRLSDLRSLRNAADYDLDTSLEEAEAVDAFHAATRTFEILTDLANEPTVLAPVVAAIRAYEAGLGEVTWHGSP